MLFVSQQNESKQILGIYMVKGTHTWNITMLVSNLYELMNDVTCLPLLMNFKNTR